MSNLDTRTITGPSPDLDINLDRGFEQWHISEIYKGDSNDPKARYVPNVNDMVISWEGGNYNPYYVEYVDPQTHIAVLKPAKQAKEPEEVDMENVLVGQGVGAVNEAYRIYLNTKTVPFTLSLSSLLHAYGSGVSHAKVFLGTDVTDNGIVISKNYDASGNYTGDNLGIEKLTSPDGNNKYIWAIRSGFCNMEIDDGEICTVVIYSESNVKISTAKLLVQNTTLVRDSNTPTREITSVHLKSDSLSVHDKHLLEVPLNLPISSIMAEAVVTYNDGTTKPVQIDGSKCALNGLRGFISSVPGIRYPLTLNYQLSPGESSAIARPGANPHISEPYWIVTKNPDRANAVKLFVQPYWVSDVEGYKLRWYLHDLDRSEPIDVTENVQLHPSTPFNGVTYGKTQHLMYTLELKSVSPEFMDLRIVQDIDILLRGGPNGTDDAFWIRYEEGTGWYGENVAAWSSSVDGRSQLCIDLNMQFEDEWLDTMYRQVCPMPDLDAGLSAPRPTHVRIHCNTGRSNSLLVECAKFKEYVNWPVLLRDTDILRFDWLIRTQSNELYLASTPVQIKLR